MLFSGSPVTVALACVIAGVAADTKVLKPWTLRRKGAQTAWNFVPPTDSLVNRVDLRLTITPEWDWKHGPGCPGANFSTIAGCLLMATCTGQSANDYFYLADGQTHTLSPNVRVVGEGPRNTHGRLQIDVRLESDSCTAGVTLVVHYTPAATFAPTPEPTLPPATPLQTWTGKTQEIGSNYLEWQVKLPGDPSHSTFFSVEFTATTAPHCTGALVTFRVGCDLDPGLGCAGFSVTGNFGIDSTTITHTAPTDIYVTTESFVVWLTQFQIGQCRSNVTPTVRYSTDFVPPPSLPPVLPTQVPPTHPPPTPVPLSPGRLCPQYESQSPGTVLITPCGAAACRTPMYYPLNGLMPQACDPCAGGMLPFHMEVQYGSTADYTITFVTGAGKVVTLDAACGSCVALQSISIELPCQPVRSSVSKGSGGFAWWVIPVIAVTAIADGVLILLLWRRWRRKNAGRRDNADLSRTAALHMHDKQELQELSETPYLVAH